jgi:hypothetical protein
MKLIKEMIRYVSMSWHRERPKNLATRKKTTADEGMEIDAESQL